MAIKHQHELRKSIEQNSLGQIYEGSEVARHLAEWVISEIESASSRGYLSGYNDGYQDAKDGKEHRHA